MAKILLIDDDGDIVRALEILLKRASHTVVTAQNENDARRVFDEHPDINLILTDKSLAGSRGTQGIALTKYFKGQRPNVPIIMQTAGFNQVDEIAFKEAGGNVLYTKGSPGSPEKLLREIETLLSQRKSGIQL